METAGVFCVDQVNPGGKSEQWVNDGLVAIRVSLIQDRIISVIGYVFYIEKRIYIGNWSRLKK